MFFMEITLNNSTNITINSDYKIKIKLFICVIYILEHKFILQKNEIQALYMSGLDFILRTKIPKKLIYAIITRKDFDFSKS